MIWAARAEAPQMRFWARVNVGAAAAARKWVGDGRAMELLIRRRGVVTVVVKVIFCRYWRKSCLVTLRQEMAIAEMTR